MSISITGFLFITGCTTPRGSASEPAIVDQAAAEATAIIQRAKATAMVLQAQAQASVLIQSASTPASTPDRTSQSPPPSFIQVPTTSQGANGTPQATTDETQTMDESEVRLLGVSIAKESGLLLVQFKAPPDVTHHWQQANVSVTDETTGAIYNEIPVMPVIGPLFARPVNENQIGYVMFVNLPVPLQSGAQVTVKLGDYIFEHVPVK